MPPIAVIVALADPTRCRIIEILHNGPQPVHVLAASFKISRPAISRHLRVLKQAKLISEKKLGRENRYALHPARLKPLSQWLAEMQASAPVKPSAPIVVAPPAAAVAPKPPRPTPISQMGFDF